MNIFVCSRLRRYSQKFSTEMIADTVKQVRSCRLPGNAMRFAGVKLQIKLLARVDKRIHHLDGVLHVNVVVTGAVHFQEMAVELVGKVDGRTVLVGCRELRHQSAITLGVDGVVIGPVSYRRNGYASLETIRMRHGVERHVAAVTPSPPSHARAIQLRKTLQSLVNGGKLVFEFHFAEVMFQCGGKFLSP